jgi:hypothetical protein
LGPSGFSKAIDDLQVRFIQADFSRENPTFPGEVRKHAGFREAAQLLCKPSFFLEWREMVESVESVVDSEVNSADEVESLSSEYTPVPDTENLKKRKKTREKTKMKKKNRSENRFDSSSSSEEEDK